MKNEDEIAKKVCTLMNKQWLVVLICKIVCDQGDGEGGSPTSIEIRNTPPWIWG